ncbi:pilus assembly protein TadG-related protein [Sinimarinibacterium flocculans]|uniref:Putative membrane protein n=1 Tax=Sinimarinibacterium flocculans TaxID=985250 RepID=A0A318ECM3_9GAMM|nr:pilus assembly protein TadG-related protein [Sinimarinibacterium flocculans]PXV70231.1 putative membrane protein [Sinimarinibacterium flocculans]
MARTRSRQAGAVAVFAAIAAGAGLAALALAIDVGRLYAAQRDLQRVANLAALDAARVTGGCFGEPEDPAGAALDEAAASIARNTGRGDVRPLTVEIGRESLAADGRRYFDPGFARTSHAVRVIVSRDAPMRLLPLAPAAGTLTAVASARSRPYASVRVGSRLLELDPPVLDRLFGALFGAPGLSISALGYASLLEANVPLSDILDSLDPGRDDEISTQPVPVAGILRRLVDSLGRSGNAIAAAAVAQIEALVDATSLILPEAIVAVEYEVARILGDALINVGDLTLVLAQATSDLALIELLYRLPPPLGDSSALIRIIEPGRPALLTTRRVPGEPDDPDFATNAQALLMTDLGVSLPPLGVNVALPLWVQVAQATAEVVDIRCARSGQPQDIVTVEARSSISRIGIGEFVDPTAPTPVMQPATLLDTQVAGSLLGLPLPVRVRVIAGASIDLPSDRRELVFTSPFPATPEPIGGPDAALLREALQALPSQLDLEVELTLLGSQAGVVGDRVNATLESARAQIEQTLRSRIATTLLAAADPLLARALRDTGLTLGGAEVSVVDLVAEEPHLFTR